MADIGCDLHLHSTHSDGRFSPFSLARLLHKRGVRVAALTDHDTFGGNPEFISELSRLDISTIPALELTTWLEAGGAGEEVHVLAMGLRLNENLALGLEQIKQQRNELQRRICERLRAEGYSFDFEQLQRRAEPDPVMVVHFVWDYLMRRPLWSALGLITGKVRRWFDHFESDIYGPGGKAYQPPPLSFAEGISWARRHGALAVVAHPAKILSPKVREAALSADIDGVEIFYKGQGSVKEELLSLAASRELVVTGGSDYHGFSGGPYSGWTIPREHVNNLLERLELSPI
jgi:predicted metal-dependent phosphoesterase TrpH